MKNSDSSDINISDLEELENEDKSSSGIEHKPWNPKDIRITTKTFTIREIFTQITEDDLDLAPDFQRSFVWKRKQQVRLIESILLGIPLPAFYFNQDRTGELQVIDGVQRLTTIKLFMTDKLVLEEENLEYLSVLKGEKFSSLEPSIKRRFSSTQIVAHVIEPQTPDEVKYDIFSRVNTGGSPLSAQEIRHCMSKKTSRDFLTSLVTSESFDLAMGNFFWTKDESGEKIRDNKRMADREMALRFCSFSAISLEDYAKAPSLDTYLMQFTRSIDYQKNNSNIESHLSKIKSRFDRAMNNCFEILGENAFRRYTLSTTRRGPINRAIFESQAIALSKHSISELRPYKKEIAKMFRTLFDDPEYDNAVRFSTGSYANVKRRLDIPQKELKKILPERNKMAAKYELYKASNGQFYFRLKAANGENILGSEGYSTKAGAINGISSVKLNSPNDNNYSQQTSSDNRYYFVLKATNHQTIGTSQMYATAQARDAGIQSVKTNGSTAETEDLT